MNTEFWKIYKEESERGKRTIMLFNPERGEHFDIADEIFKFQEQKESNLNAEILSARYTFLAANMEVNNLSLVGEDNRSLYKHFIDEFEIRDYRVDENGKIVLLDIIVQKDDYRAKLDWVATFSTYLYLAYEFYKPILFTHNFSFIQRACDVLDIVLPHIPHTNDHRQYLYYYFDLCETFNAFQKENNLTDAEFCACLYDFSSMYLDTKKDDTELTAPTNIWLTGASKADIKYIEETGINESVWACNERTRRGDIVILYALAPHSCIHSIWRANSGGQFNPFDFYHCRTTVRDGVIIPPISNKELKVHPYFSQLPIVRRNMQGVNGIELSAQDYIELLKIIESKGFDTGKLPQLYIPTDYNTPEVHVEKDVEEKILIPLLEKLGYTSEDYTRQLSQKAGRGLKAIPDFVFFPHGEKHFHTAPFVIEAKRDMRSARELDAAFEQALSYSRMLQNSIMGICDKERLILYSVENGVADRSNPIFENHWAVIYTDVSIFQKLKKLIGRDIICKL